MVDLTVQHEPPADPLFDEVWAVGASLSMGFRSGAIAPFDQRRSPPALLARGMGAYMPLPLLVDGLLTHPSNRQVGQPDRRVIEIDHLQNGL